MSESQEAPVVFLEDARLHGVGAALRKLTAAGERFDLIVRDAQIFEKLEQPANHPVGLHFPEGEYLKGLILRVVG